MKYIVITFPEIQELMDAPGFDDNTFLINDEKGLLKFGPCSYFVNEEWYNKINKNKQ